MITSEVPMMHPTYCTLATITEVDSTEEFDSLQTTTSNATTIDVHLPHHQIGIKVHTREIFIIE